MPDLIAQKQSLPAMSSDAINQVRHLESIMLDLPQVDIETSHTLHGGAYTRTIMIPAGVILSGALIKIPTTLIIAGTVTVFIGDETIELQGYNVMTASAGRKQAFMAHTNTWLTMIFPTQANSVEQAENEFTDETDLLGSRRKNSRNNISITEE